jgi:DNA-binding beta-propeller fold protein YncE
MPSTRLRTLAALALAVVLIVAAHGRQTAAIAQPARGVSAVVFEAPAGRRAAGPLSIGSPFDRVLPSGRIIHPAGTSVVVGMHAGGVALSPDGRFAIVSNDDERGASVTTNADGQTMGGYSLTVVDTTTMRVVDRYRSPGESFYAGIVATADPASAGGTLVLASGGPSNAVYAFDLDTAGQLVPDAHHTIAIPGPTDARFASAGHSFPSTLVVAPSGTHAYVVDNVGDDIAEIDLATRTLAAAPVPVGFFPFGAAYSTAGLLVANEGLGAYGVLPQPAAAPPFASPAVDLARASSLSLLTINGDETLGTQRSTVALDRGLDGVRAIGGTHPAAIVAERTKPFAFVAMASVDRIATIGLEGAAAAAVGGTELRLYDRGPYGTQPVALALSPDERRLFVALAGIDAVAVLDVSDPLHPHRIGLIPTGWYPDALALSPNGRYLFVANAKGYGTDRNFTGDRAEFVDSHGRVMSVGADGTADWSTLERIDTQTLNLRRSTPLALACLRAIRPARPSRIVPQIFASSGSTVINHVVFILEENKTFDAVLGDLKDASGRAHGPGSPEYVAFDESVTPNLHALARRFALAGNMYADADESHTGHQVAFGGIASAYTERTSVAQSGRLSYPDANEDPEDDTRAGYVFNSLAERGETYRDYGDLLRVAGYDDGGSLDPKTDDPNFLGVDDAMAPTAGLGGRYALDVPAPLALSGHVDLNYPGWNPRIRDMRRAAEFVRDFDPYVRANRMPAFTSIWLPDGAAAGSPGVAALPETVADGDRALGQIVEYLTHIPQWRSTAILITPASAERGRDHLDEHRTYAIVVSPYARRGYVGTRHVSTVSVLKTEEEILGLPALSLGDALATDLSDLFTSTPDPAPFLRIDAATQTP